MTAIVIPALDPDAGFPDYVKRLRAATDSPFVFVDDGSRPESATVFDAAMRAAGENSTLLSHDVNRGKGRALKTAFEHILKTWPDAVGCVTADSDGQHSVQDVVEAIRLLETHPDALVLGCRRFDGPDVPPRSSFGNRWMRFLFKLATGRDFQDTQTGLRGIPSAFMRELLDAPGERFEFESEMLLRAAPLPLEKFQILTIYENENRGSHFRPVADSIPIVKLVLRPICKRLAGFTAVSLLSFGVDIGAFCLLWTFVFPETASARLLMSVAIARCVSTAFNYLGNRYLVFRPRLKRVAGSPRSLPRYLALAAVLLAASWLFSKIWLAVLPGTPAAVAKAVVDFVLFFGSFAIQRTFVFRA